MQLHTRHFAFGLALPAIIIAQAILAQNSSPEELASAQNQAAFLIPIISTIVAGFVDILKAWLKDSADAQKTAKP